MSYKKNSELYTIQNLACSRYEQALETANVEKTPAHECVQKLFGRCVIKKFNSKPRAEQIRVINYADLLPTAGYKPETVVVFSVHSTQFTSYVNFDPTSSSRLNLDSQDHIMSVHFGRIFDLKSFTFNSL